MQDKDPRPSATAVGVEPAPEPRTEQPPESPPDRKKQWVRLADERSFGSITGSEFHVWGE